jgi:urocanate hydratase
VGGGYTVGISFEEANTMMAENPLFKEKYRNIAKTHDAINKHTAKGTYFFDYGNAFFEASRAGADIWPKIISISNIKLRSRHHGTYVF